MQVCIKSASLTPFMSDHTQPTTETPLYDIEENYPRQLTSEEIGTIRSRTYGAAWEVMTGYKGTHLSGGMVVGDDEDVDETHDEGQPPPAEPVIRRREESWIEATRRQDQMKRQLHVSVRHINELLEIDDQVSGNPERGCKGINLPVRHIGQRGKHHAVIVTRNTWGSTPVEEDTELQERLKAQCTQPDADGTPVFDQAAYRTALRQYQRDHTHADLPVLGEDDRVDIFDANEEHIGSAVVREVIGDTVRLHFHSPVRLKKGCFLRKRSNRRALETYRDYVHAYCQKLQCTSQMTDRDGRPYWERSAGDDSYAMPVNTGGMGGMHRTTRGEYGDDDDRREMVNALRMSLPEQFFFSEEWTDSRTEAVRSTAYKNTLEDEDIPRKILDDDEQACAFTLGAMGHPCMLIQGPAGTGKTTVASLLTKHFQELRKKTLILSHSNRGLDVLLLAAQERGVKLHRGGTEVGACDRRLRDTFIRKGLVFPRRVEFLVPTFDREAFDAAQAAFDPDSGQPAPMRDDFVNMELDLQRWDTAWDLFEQQKEALLAKLEKEDGLVAGVTLNSLISDEIIQALNFDVVIVDEASKGFIYEFLPALKKAGKQIIFIGDHKQLGNITIPPLLKKRLEDPASQDETTEENAQTIYEEDTDFFEGGPFKFMAEQAIVPQVMLRTDRRSLKDLVRAVSFGAYDGKLKAGRKDHDDPENGGSLLWVDTSGRPDCGEVSAGVSRINPLEARLIARRLMDAFERGELSQGSFGVIAMYRAQVNQILRQARKTHPKRGGSREEFLAALKGNVATVDSFQGSERDTIYLATTRSNESGSVGFLDDVRRTNVAASRAGKNEIIYGNPKTLIEDNPDPASSAYFRVLYDICAQHGKIVSAFSTLPGQVRPEEQKKQTRNARWKRKRRAKRREDNGQQ